MSRSHQTGGFTVQEHLVEADDSSMRTIVVRERLGLLDQGERLLGSVQVRQQVVSALEQQLEPVGLGGGRLDTSSQRFIELTEVLPVAGDSLHHREGVQVRMVEGQCLCTGRSGSLKGLKAGLENVR
jgi:hypothetical protein